MKRKAAIAALEELPPSGVIGIGTGSTAKLFIDALAKLGRPYQCVPTSDASRKQAASLGLALLSDDGPWDIAVTVDGADEVDPQLNLIKGGGGALLHEKIVVSASRQVIIIADSSKQVCVLGKVPLPVEVIRFAEALVSEKISVLGATVRLRKDKAGKPFITDEGNHILDCHFGQIPDPPALAHTLSEIPGVVEHGLFINLADLMLLGKGSEVLEFRREPLTEQ